MTRPVRFKEVRRKREPDRRPADFFVKRLIELRESDPKQFDKETKGKPQLVELLKHYERTVKG